MNPIDIHGVLKHLPHRYPMLLIDRVLDYTKDVSLTAIKNVTMNEPFFPGHFPHHPVMPGVLILEALAQACAILSFRTMERLPTEKSVYYFVGIDKARFRRPVEPGDQLRLEVAVKRKMKGVWLFETSASVGGELCASAELMCTYKETA
ncbi:MAG: 3-hydroxyacyl-[acyl-carrier-protein] dehydratase FabZ [Candidatus Muproteobacteria bacterium RIFCSPHIGHO2_01_FULL_65_16]|uniref:3-hydroxyacyl-[acyl-carrier-protein] dehydratase FabZ n=1 Tax=Candidatus Muproteobacteria bacterium RIFCSPHIGHO2_01_FULL_65_16 TaxID=1817764 RepID=A0A1F6TRC0_9PROT|nr:MAG: 3-hydroxyacyl-[acyl-carrier-protein] dehydratase FabZ [Candidatus Muproteobacteria bacterium RIFCSPHIGHO2_01_FULL_65_16]